MRQRSVMALAALKIGAAALILATLALPSPLPGQPATCPPGLAKKDPPCVPPGLARQGTEALETLGPWRIGDRLPEEAILYRDGGEASLAALLPPLEDGQTYVVVDGGILAIDRTTLEILRILAFATGG